LSPTEIIFSPNAEKEIKRLQNTDMKIVLGALEKFSAGEGKNNVEKIKANPCFFRLKVGSFRLIYYPLSHERVVLLLIRDRKNAYKNLGDLDKRLETAIRKLKIAKG